LKIGLSLTAISPHAGDKVMRISYLLVFMLVGCAAQGPQRELTPEERAAVLQYMSSQPQIQPYQGQAHQMMQSRKRTRCTQMGNTFTCQEN
jgi:hypothetical protein